MISRGLAPYKPVLVIIENILSAISTRHHVVNRASCLVSQKTRHTRPLLIQEILVNVCYLGLTPKQWNSLTRRTFLKRTGGASVASIVSWNLATKAAGAIVVGTSSHSHFSYSLMGDWHGDATASDPTYSEEVKPFLALLSRLGITYSLKIKKWTSPGSGVSANPCLSNQYAIELFYVGSLTNANKAADATSPRRNLVVWLPDENERKLAPDTLDTTLLEVQSAEKKNPWTYYKTPLPLQDGYPTWLTTLEPTRCAAASKVTYVSTIYACCLASKTLNVPEDSVEYILDIESKVYETFNFYDSAGALMVGPVYHTFDAPHAGSVYLTVDAY